MSFNVIFGFQSSFKKILVSKELFSLFKRRETHYEVLKLPESCTSKEVREAFISLSKQNHPDKHRNDPGMHIRFVKINEAYSVLRRPSSRKAYDIALERNRTPSPPGPGPNTNFNQFYNTHDEFGIPYSFGRAKSQKEPFSDADDYYGIKGMKRVSNTTFLYILLSITFLISVLHILRIRYTIMDQQNRSFEESRKNSILLSMAKERAKLYGNDYQVEMLKNSLKASYSLSDNMEEKYSKDSRTPSCSQTCDK